jgi:hypothetical protein
MQKLAQPEYTLEEIYKAMTGTHRVAKIEHIYYDDLVRYLGEPSINEESGDGKTQFEWVFTVDDSVFTIYDWKTYDRDYSLQELTQWNIGGTADNKDKFIKLLQSRIKKPTKIL